MSKSLLSVEHMHSEEAAFAFVEARLWPDGAVCPHCGNCDPAKIRRFQGKATRIGLHKCKACGGQFTVKMGTVMESSHLPLRLWLQAIYLMCSSKKGVSARQLQRTFQCSMKTAWFLEHRVRLAMADLHINGSGQLGGANKVVEIDETYVGGKAKNRKNHVPPKAPVVSLVERDGSVRSFHVADVNGANLRPILQGNIDKRTNIMTDDSTVYPPLTKDFAGHDSVNHSIEEYVRLGGFVHTNTVEGYFSILKRGVVGIYHHVSHHHLHRYLDEFDFRYNNRVALGINDVTRADRALLGTRGKRLTYATPRHGRPGTAGLAQEDTP